MPDCCHEKYLSAKQINRAILLSDGLANVGPSSTRDLRRLGRELSRRGIAVTTIGVGDDYNEDLMAGLAEASDANYYYVGDTELGVCSFNKGSMTPGPAKPCSGNRSTAAIQNRLGSVPRFGLFDRGQR